MATAIGRYDILINLQHYDILWKMVGSDTESVIHDTEGYHIIH